MHFKLPLTQLSWKRRLHEATPERWCRNQAVHRQFHSNGVESSWLLFGENELFPLSETHKRTGNNGNLFMRRQSSGPAVVL
ncbi:hypothetical protein CEXT_629751 [Caerostris extrusa]|uniref:Ycf15 n=1 Tax=Caerostris extrusa TaxID=172846 RepID=A0AAV4WR82_CAEEX|nr:hypothetical protein CEXT_629751 [Caerostris extrusa]